MIVLLLLSLVVIIPIVELWIILQVGHAVGIIPTIASLVAISMAGTALVKHEGFKVFREFNATISRGEIPSREIAHGACLLIAGVFLLAPGFVTDVLAIALLAPPVRGLVVRLALRRRRGTRRVTIRRGEWSSPRADARGMVTSRSWEVIDVETNDDTTTEDGHPSGGDRR